MRGAGLAMIKEYGNKLNVASASMRMKLFLFLMALVLTMLAGILIILSVCGVFQTGINEIRRQTADECGLLAQTVTEQLGKVSVYAEVLSTGISKSIEQKLAERGAKPEELRNDSVLLETVIAGEFERLLFEMERAGGSGAFFILDATINPSVEGAENSRAGLYIKNMEPNIINAAAPNIILLRGPSQVGRENSVTLHSQWRMEFDVSDAPYYSNPLKAAWQFDKPVSRMYYWSHAGVLPNTTEPILLCSIPVILPDKTVIGVCGLEISEMLFKLSNVPKTSSFQRMAGMLAPYGENKIDVGGALVAGRYTDRTFEESGTLLTTGNYGNGLNTYNLLGKNVLVGLHQEVKLYPEDTVFGAEKWAAVVTVPAEDVSYYLRRANRAIILLLTCLLALGIAASYLLSRKYILPITRSIDRIKAGKYDEEAKTKIAEIDDLIEFLSRHREAGQKETGSSLTNDLFGEFVENTKRLSPAERAVFNLYVEGYTAQEITKILCLSINTIKTHNKRIYMKLNVASRKELLVYVNMLKQAGQDLK